MRRLGSRRLLLALLLAIVFGSGQAVAQQAEEPGGPVIIDGVYYWPDTIRHAEWNRGGDPGDPLAAESTDSVNALQQNTPGTFWSNGPFDNQAGLASEIDTFAPGVTARVADDFDVGVGAAAEQLPIPNGCVLARIDEVRSTLLHSSGSDLAEFEIWSNSASGGRPAENADENDADVLDGVFTTMNENQGNFVGFPILEYTWDFGGGIFLGPGRYWTVAIGYGPGGRSFRASSAGGPDGSGSAEAHWRSSTFGVPNWQPVSSVIAPSTQMAFDIDGECVVEASATFTEEDEELFCETNELAVDFTFTAVTGTADLAGPEVSIDLPNAQVISCDSSVGTCQASGTTAEVNFALGAGQTANVTVVVSPPDGVIAEIDTPVNIAFDFSAGAGELSSRLFFRCEPTVDPNSQLGRQVHLPVLNFQGQEEACDTWIEVQNLGREEAKAVLVTWAAPGFCPPQCAGPLKVECSGLLKPGSTWNYLSAQIPSGAKSGILFKFSARQLREIGVDLGDEDIVADAMCETLFFGVVGDCDDYRRFKKAYNEGLDFGGVPQDLAAGVGSLAVDVLRTCPADTTLGVDVTSKYNGIAGTHLGTFDPVFGGFSYYVPLVYADRGGFNSIMYIQNGGLECSSVEIWFKAQDDCLRARICEVFALAPGETFQFDATECVGPEWQGSAWVRTSQPTGIAVDIIGRDVLMTYIGEPAEINYVFDPDRAVATPGNQVAYGPLIYSEYQGWDSGIQVQNLSSVHAAKVKVYFLDRSGDIITTLVDWICPRGSQTFFLPVVHDLPGSWVGSVRVESQEWWSPGDPLVLPPNIVGVASLIRYSDAARTETQEAIAYNLLPEHKAFDWQVGAGAGGTTSGIGLIAIPSLLKDLDTTGITSEVAIANLVPKPGFTDFAIYIFDQNGLLDYVCQKLNEKQVEYIDLQTWGYVSPGFKGSAIISATFWEHEVFDGEGNFLRNLLGLSAVAVERSGTRLGEDVPGDEAAGARGIPFRTFVNEDEDRYEFAFVGPAVPLCPGQPGGAGERPDPFGCQVVGPIEISCEDPECNDRVIPDNSGGQPPGTSVIPVLEGADLPAGCDTVEDVDVRLTLIHPWDEDMDVTLTSPEVGPVELFTDICGTNDDVKVILDDAATQPVGSVCPPEKYLRYDTEMPDNLQLFEGTSPFGEWVLTVQDDAVHPLFGYTGGIIRHWSLILRVSDGE